MKILVSQHEQATQERRRVEKYVNWGVIYDVVPLDCSLYIALLEVPEGIQKKLEPQVRKKRFEGGLYSCSCECFSPDDVLRDDKKTRVGVFESTGTGFKYRVLLKPGQKLSYTEV